MNLRKANKLMESVKCSLVEVADLGGQDPRKVWAQARAKAAKAKEELRDALDDLAAAAATAAEHLTDHNKARQMTVLMDQIETLGADLSTVDDLPKSL